MRRRLVFVSVCLLGALALTSPTAAGQTSVPASIKLTMQDLYSILPDDMRAEFEGPDRYEGRRDFRRISVEGAKGPYASLAGVVQAWWKTVPVEQVNFPPSSPGQKTVILEVLGAESPAGRFLHIGITGAGG